MQQLARSREQGGLKLQLPAIKCKALLVNRHLQEIISLPYYNSLLTQNFPPPADLPCLKLLTQQIPLLPHHIQQNPSSDQIHRFYLEQTETPRVERNHPGINWRKIWTNISSRSLSSCQRSDLYMLVNEKTEHRRLMSVIGRANDHNCLHCTVGIETLKHKFSECPRVAAAWAYMQRRITLTLGGWQRLAFDDLIRPILGNITTVRRNEILKLFFKYIHFINGNVNNIIDVGELEFILNLEE